MPTVNDRIADGFLRHQVDLLRIEAGQEQDILVMMRELSAELSARLASIPDGAAPSRRLQRLAGLRKQADGLIDDLYAKLETETSGDLQDAARLELGTVPEIINSAIGVDLASITITTELINSLAKETLFQGAPIGDWWQKQAATLKMDFMRQMRMGILQGENLSDLTRRLRGRKENGYADGLLPPLEGEAGRLSKQALSKATRDAQGLAVTAVQTVMADARMQVYRQNTDVIKGIMQSSTLDKRTSPVCRTYDHAMWDLSGKPIGAKQLPFNGGPPRHWRCRSVLVPVTKSWEELGIKGKKEIPPGTRASMDGQVPATLDYETWLKGKPEAFQKEILGPARFRLWQDGSLPFSQMVDQRGNPVSIADLAGKK